MTAAPQSIKIAMLMHAQALFPVLLLLCVSTQSNLPQQESATSAPVPESEPKQDGTSTSSEEADTSRPVLDDKVESERLRLEAEYFITTDYDGDGWISYREGQSALLMTRASFAQYDIDSNGRITSEEFKRRYRELMALTGVFRRPTPQGVSLPMKPSVDPAVTEPVDLVGLLAEKTVPLFSSPEAFVSQFDENVDGRLSAPELANAGISLGFASLAGEQTLATLDSDGSGYIEPPELVGALIALGGMAAAGTAPTLPKAKSIEELYGGGEARPSYAGSTPRPPYIKGPVRPFRRLDVNDNGMIELIDLDMLSVSAHPRIRPAAVIANLDLDGNGALSPDELAAAFDG